MTKTDKKLEKFKALLEMIEPSEGYPRGGMVSYEAAKELYDLFIKQQKKLKEENLAKYIEEWFQTDEPTTALKMESYLDDYEALASFIKKKLKE